jgi:hypothetical protein
MGVLRLQHLLGGHHHASFSNQTTLRQLVGAPDTTIDPVNPDHQMVSAGMLGLEDRDQIRQGSVQPCLASQNVVAPVESGVVGGTDDQVISAVRHDGALEAREHQVSAIPQGL